MARNINFQFDYPYNVWAAESRYFGEWYSSQISLNGFNVTPFDFKKSPAPYIVDADITMYMTPTSGTNASGRSWRLYYLVGGSWSYATFNMPSVAMNTEIAYTWTGAIGGTVTRFAACPASSAYSHYWTLGFGFDRLKVRENINTVDLVTTDYFTAFPNYGGVTQRPTQVYADVGGVLTPAKKVYANIGETLIELPPAYSGAYVSTVPDSFRVYEFTPPTTGTYKIMVERKSGDHEARLYNSSFVDQNGGNYFYDASFSLTGGSVYFIMLTHYYYNTATSDSLIFITKV